MAETLGFPVPLPQRFRLLSITYLGFLTTCVPRALFAAILRRIDRLRGSPVAAA
jgi:hypothetical protein